MRTVKEFSVGESVMNIDKEIGIVTGTNYEASDKLCVKVLFDKFAMGGSELWCRADDLWPAEETLHTVTLERSEINTLLRLIVSRKQPAPDLVKKLKLARMQSQPAIYITLYELSLQEKGWYATNRIRVVNNFIVSDWLFGSIKNCINVLQFDKFIDYTSDVIQKYMTDYGRPMPEWTFGIGQSYYSDGFNGPVALVAEYIPGQHVGEILDETIHNFDFRRTANYDTNGYIEDRK